jgi:hypothetical protein
MARGIRNFIAKAVYGKEISAMREENNKLVDEVMEIKTKLAAHIHSFDATVKTDVNATMTLLAEVKSKLGSHVHAGVTAGSDSSAVATTLTYTAPDPTAIASDHDVTLAPPTITYTNPEARKIT